MYKPKYDNVKPEASFNGFYRGEVVDRADPMKAGRVKIRVFSVFDDISVESIPWAIMADPFMGGQAGFGGCFIPDTGSHVWVFFEVGDPDQPVYFAGAPARPHGPPEKETDYPDNHVYKTRTGHLIEINDWGEIIHVQHSSGTEMIMHPNGDITVNTKDITVNCVNSIVNCEDSSTVNCITSTVNAFDSINFDTPVVKVSGDVEVEGDVIASDISLVEHIHEGVNPGSGLSGPPFL